MIAIVVTLKQGPEIKSRLSEILFPDQRRQLSQAMLQDVARALAASRAEHLFLLTAEGRAEVTAPRGFELLSEQRQVSESSSVDAAAKRLKADGFAALLRLPADIPLIEAEDVDLLLDEGQASPNILVPSWDGGTNALLRCPVDAFPSRFGPGSRGKHLEEAEKAGVPLKEVRLPRVALDIDAPEDLRRFAREARRGETLQWLQRLKSETRTAAAWRSSL